MADVDPSVYTAMPNYNPEHLPEGFVPDDAALAIHAVLTDDFSFADGLKHDREELAQITDNLLASTFDPHERQVVETVGELLQWKLFGRPGDKLPSPYVLGLIDDNHKRIDLRPDFNEDGVILWYPTINNAYLPAGLANILQRRQERLTKDQGWAVRVLSRAVEHQPEFAFLRSFGDDVRTETETPLTAQERARRRQEIDRTVRHNFGLTQDDSLVEHPDVSHIITRQNFKLEEETRPHAKAADSDDPLERVRQYFYDSIALQIEEVARLKREHNLSNRTTTKFDEAETTERLVDISQDLNTGEVVVSTTRATYSATDYTKPYTLAHSVLFPTTYESENGFSRPHNLSRGIYYGALQLLFARQRPQNFDEFLQNLSHYVARHEYSEILHELSNQLAGNFGFEPYSAMNKNDYLKQPSDAPFDAAAITAAQRAFKELHPPHHYAMLQGSRSMDHLSYNSREELQEAASEQVGEVIQARPADTEGRLIVNISGRTEELPLVDYTQAGQLIVRMDGFYPGKGHRQNYMIPGYRTVGFNPETQDFAFAYDEATLDPHQPADVAIDNSRLRDLAITYRYMGLDILAESVEQAENLTVAGLVELIRQNSYYRAPEAEERLFIQAPQRLEDFALPISDGLLMTQCDTSAVFLQLSLEGLFGPGRTSLVNGYVINPGVKKVDGLKHAQVLFGHEGRNYILDATPSQGDPTPGVTGIARGVPSADTPTRESRSDRRAQKRILAQAAARQAKPEDVGQHPEELEAKTRAIMAKLTPADADEIKAATQAARQTDARSLLEAQLRTILQVNTIPEVYQQVAKLDSSDPVARTLGAIIKATTEVGLTGEEAQGLYTYLDNYQKATPAVLKRAQLKAYSADTLQMLSRTAGQLLS